MATIVNIYLPVGDRQILALSIPSIEIDRFSLRPVKWLRFVTFAICGVRGHLSATPKGPPVEYDNIPLNCIAGAYYYIPDGVYHLIDHNVMNDRLTSSIQTPRSSNFCRIVTERDGNACVFTGERASMCEAVHLIPKSKGDEYMDTVLQDRLGLYDSDVEPSGLGIDSVENGLFLSSNLHKAFARGECAFLKTPNFALDLVDIPKVEEDSMSFSRITLHLWEPSTGRPPILQSDARIAGTGTSPPSTVVLDFIYGVAAYQRWKSGNDIEELMHDHFSTCYASIPIPPASNPHGHPSTMDNSPEPDDPNNSDYVPNMQHSTQLRGRNHHSNISDEMSHAMDDVLALSMLLKGNTQSPESVAVERQRREEMEELHAKETSQAKVVQWMQTCSSPARLDK